LGKSITSRGGVVVVLLANLLILCAMLLSGCWTNQLLPALRFKACCVNQLGLGLSVCWVNHFPLLSRCQSAG